MNAENRKRESPGTVPGFLFFAGKIQKVRTTEALRPRPWNCGARPEKDL